jgi:peptidoglycan hydrolase-like protein with peptidoglycan-binding domain
MGKKSLTAFAFGAVLAAGMVLITAFPSISLADATSTAAGTFLQNLLLPPSAATRSIALYLGEKNVAVFDLQGLLIGQGYLSVVAPTGYFGSATEVAVMAAQKAQNVPRTGAVVIPVSELAAFYAVAAPRFSPVVVGSTGTRVKFFQQFLIQHGYLDISTSTGNFGAMTKAAVIAFQKAKNLPQTGIIDQATFAAITGK